MLPIPSRTRQRPQDDQSGSLPSRPVSPLPSPSPISPDPTHSAASSTNLPSHENVDSTTASPRYPHPAWFANHSSTSLTSDYSHYGGSTACTTPTPEGAPSSDNCSESKETSKSVDSLKKSADTVYTIETIHQHDDVELLTPWKRRLYRISPLFTILALGTYFLYYGYRIHCTLYAQRSYHKTYIMAWLFIGAEGCIACPALLHQLFQMLSIRGRRRPKLRLQGQNVPTVDVFITCCKEDVDIVMDTARAACAVDYPQDRFRVVVLDDGKDGQLEKAVRDLSEQHPNLYYHARTKIAGVPHHFKAGNLRGGTDFVTKLEGGEAEYIAALDADMIPEAEWLRAIIAHMANDPEMALVCPPQQFYNIPDNDPLSQSLDTFVHVMETTKDANGVAWCTGSGYAIRRKALESIGGFAIGSLSEDVLTSSLLLGAGWKTAYCHEALQCGTVPDTLTGHLKQRTRWNLGTLQTGIKLKFCLYGPLTKGMSFFARLSSFVFVVDVIFKIFLLMALLTIPIALISGGRLVAYSSEAQLRWQVRLSFGTLVLSRLNEWITYLPSGYRLSQRDTKSHIWMAPFHAITLVRSFILPSWLGGKAMAFSSSGSIQNGLNERDAKTRAPLFRRLKVILWDCGVYLHVLYIMFVVAAVTYSTVRGVENSKGLQPLLIYLLTHAFWPPVLWILCITACCEPIHYAIWPPGMPDREEMLDRDPQTGIARPKAHWKKQRYTKRTLWHEMQYSGLTIFTTVIFVMAFFFL